MVFQTEKGAISEIFRAIFFDSSVRSSGFATQLTRPIFSGSSALFPGY
ncbi:MAG: hypothetical protein QW752_02780 [Thermoplasmata archaeon]